ncbi:MAG: peptidase U32 [Candidatus Magasanikbacteria bacterium]|jgi:U32 family peptidase|nr:peptidase U32 [Candidatus Magasanikbacteria bacterium]MBT5262559.1 peptidase U32 [Candidatus Magasanikbacteria bacterium]MBT5820522.1 peptidase U32 [Candidatus Magasanikbacteria bacterium]MBT6294120.1 peptidase U32 [Candidatus Magasanikbacteria bacterium]
MPKPILRSELLMPAGSLHKMKTAILYGADAVYCGTPDLSLRTKAQFTLEELVEGIEYAHKKGKKVYLTLNLFSHNKDIPKLKTLVDTIKDVRPDGVIIADPGVFSFVKKHAPDLELHISTQANVCSHLTVDYWKEQGAKLVVLAREVSFEELAEIKEKCPDTKLETFIHGAMCMTYSGRCLLSNFLSERGANQGNCSQSCRWKYKMHVQLKDGTLKEIQLTDENKDLFEFFLEEGFRPGEFMPIQETERGAYILNAKDLCLMPKLNEYLELGIDSLKVEGRNKTNYYAALVARSYRHAIDAWVEDPENWDHEPFLEELYTLQNRGYSLAFHNNRLTNLAHNYDSAKSVAQYENAGYIREWDGDDIIFEVKNRIDSGDLIEILSPAMWEPIRLRITECIDAETGEITDAVSAGQNKAIRLPASIFLGLEGKNIKELLPQHTVARKEKSIIADPERLKRDMHSFSVEAQGSCCGTSESPCDKSKKTDVCCKKEKKEMPESDNSPKTKKPKFGTDACCGKGCNGCLMFWHDTKFAGLRDKMKDKKIGETL